MGHPESLLLAKSGRVAPVTQLTGGLALGLRGPFSCGGDDLAFDAILATEQFSCTALPCSSTTQASRETAFPHIQQATGAFDPDATNSPPVTENPSAFHQHRGKTI